MFLSRTTVEAELHHILQNFSKISNFPASGIFNEYWFMEELDRAGYFDAVLGLQWALMAGYLDIYGACFTGAWQMALKAGPAPKLADQPPLYIPATHYEEVGEYNYPALPPAICHYLTTAHFACYSATAERWRPTYHTLAQLIAPVAPSAYGGGQALRSKSPTDYADLTEPLHFQKLAGPAVQLSAFALYFDEYIKLQRVCELLTEDLCLASYLLLVLFDADNRRLVLVAQLPAGYADLDAARKVLPEYCLQRFRAWGCRPHYNSSNYADLCPLHPLWVHPSLYLSFQRR